MRFSFRLISLTSHHHQPGAAMQPVPPPSKEVVRTWLAGRVMGKKLVPSRDEIRRQLGWPTNTKSDCAR